jgi:ABC-type multidrug transport system fused ATPase/permease subunit
LFVFFVRSHCSPTWVSWVGWVLVASLFVTQVVVALTAARMLWANSAFGIAVRSGVTRLLVDKMCVLTSTGKVAAHVLNVCSNDLQRIFMMFMFTPILAGGVFGLLGVCVALLARFDVAGLPPAGVLVLSFLANQLLSRLASRFSARVLPLTDQRVKLMSHIVRAIAVVKLFAWEDLLGQRVASVRRQELDQRQKASTVAAVLEAVALSTILIASLLFLVTWSLLGRPFVASEVFTGLSLVIIGRIPLIQVQLFAQYAGEARASFGRIAGVLLLPSLPPSAVQVLTSFLPLCLICSGGSRGGRSDGGSGGARRSAAAWRSRRVLAVESFLFVRSGRGGVRGGTGGQRQVDAAAWSHSGVARNRWLHQNNRQLRVRRSK